MEAERELPRALMGGTAAMRKAAKKYLPQEPQESGEAYDIRLSRTFLFNGFAKTVRDMAGKVFAKPIGIGEDMPAEFERYAENIDLSGRNLDVFAHTVFVDALAEGISYILVEMEPAVVDEGGQPVSITRAQEREMGRRPWMVHIRARDMLGWRSEIVNGVDVLRQVRFLEVVTEDDGDFGETEIEQVRVFTRGPGGVTLDVYRKTGKADVNGSQEWVIHDSTRLTINEIALCPVYVARTGFMSGTPPLKDLAELNLAHWQSQSDQRNILHVARVPILFGAGFEEGTSLTVGASSMVISSDPASKLSYVEHSGAAIAAGREELKDLEHQMQALGLELLIPRPGGQTATGAAIDQARMNAPLAMMANALKDALEQAFGFMALYAGISRDQGGGSLTVNTDYGVAASDAPALNTLLAAVQNGLITHRTFIQELKRYGVIAESVDEEAEIEALGIGFDLDDPAPVVPPVT